MYGRSGTEARFQWRWRLSPDVGGGPLSGASAPLSYSRCRSSACHFVRERLYEGWTPEQISGWLEAGNENLPLISFEAIYDWLYGPTQKPEKPWKLLPRKRAKRGRRTRRRARNAIAGRRSIHDRPEDVDRRKTADHWEGNLMICKRTRPVLVLKERKSRFVIAAKLNGKTAFETAGVIMDVFRRLAQNIRKSITFDNGGEFAKHGLIRDALNMTPLSF